MTNELQTDAPDGITLDNENEEANIGASETDKGGAELATAAGETQSKNNDGLTNQDDPNGQKKSINKQHAKFREQERRADGLDEQLAKANEKLSAFEAEKKEVNLKVKEIGKDFTAGLQYQEPDRCCDEFQPLRYKQRPNLLLLLCRASRPKRVAFDVPCRCNAEPGKNDSALQPDRFLLAERGCRICYPYLKI